MAFVTIEDLYGTCEIIVFDTCFAKCSHILFNDNIVIVDGRLSLKEDEFPKIVANEITEFNENIDNIQNYKEDEIEKINEEKEEKQEEQNKTKISEKPKHLVINITNMDEIKKAKLRGAIKFFNGDRNNIAIGVKQDEKILPCGAIYLTEDILKEFKNIVGENNIILQ